jgi:hypothetical protein
VRDELDARDNAIANLKTELEAGENKQLTNPDPIKPVLGGTVELLTVDTPGLIEYINSIDPESRIIAKTIGNAITRKNNGKGEVNGGKGRTLTSLEETYNFKHLGKVDNSHKFSIPNL